MFIESPDVKVVLAGVVLLACAQASGRCIRGKDTTARFQENFVPVEQLSRHDAAAAALNDAFLGAVLDHSLVPG